MSQPNIILLVMDTARASTVSKMLSDGHLPNIKKIAREGSKFDKCLTTGPWTLPSHASMFTGEYTSDHNSHAGNKNFSPDGTVLAEYARKKGYQTIAYSNNTWVSPEFGFDTGFDEFLVRWEVSNDSIDLSSIEKADSNRERLKLLVEKVKEDPKNSILNFFYALYLNFYHQNDSGAKRTNERLANYLDSDDFSSPFFLFVNYVEPHLPYDPPSKFKHRFGVESGSEEVNQDPWRYLSGDVEMQDSEFKTLESLYKAELAYLDERLGELFDHLRSVGEYEDSVIIITGDHGENIGDYGFMDHQFCLYDSLINVPLICRHPDYFPQNMSFDGLVELRDIFPTILELLEVDIESTPDHTSSNSLLFPDETSYSRDYVIAEYLEPQPSQEALSEYTVSTDNDLSQYDRALRCIRTESWKYLEGSDGTESLFDLTKPNGESVDVSKDNSDVISELRNKIKSKQGPLVRNPGDDNQEMREDTKQRLEDLGYLQ
ncbi:sulfatase [Haloferax marisrubri]|nr:sulfatase [Haloferax marisrubri]